MRTYKIQHLVLATIAFSGIITPIQALAATVTLLPTEGFRIAKLGYLSDNPEYLSVYNDGGSNIQNSIMRFEFSSVPNYAVINSAILTLTAKSPYAQQIGTQHSDVFAVADQWDINANWNYATGVTPWSTPGGDVTGATYATNFETIMGEVAVTWDITSLISQWTSGSLVNNGLMLKGSVNNQLSFYPINGVDSLYVPKLSITYAIPEPSALFLSGVFVLGLLCKRRRTDVTD